jgi:hypothetical protein
VPELRQAPLGVFLLRDSGKASRWRSFSLPGNRVYLPVGFLRNLEFENEVAALIAVEFGHLIGRHAVARYEKLRNPQDSEAPLVRSESLTAADYFGSNGIFAFSPDALEAAFKAAVGILYSAGYDPRGLSGILSRYARAPSRAPYDPATIARLEEATRLEIANHAPLRNPIVRSQEFVGVQINSREATKKSPGGSRAPAPSGPSPRSRGTRAPAATTASRRPPGRSSSCAWTRSPSRA